MTFFIAVLLAAYALGMWSMLTHWSALTPKSRKITAFFTLGLFPFLWVMAVAYQDLERVKHVGFCEKCHTMRPFVDNLKSENLEPLSTLHYQNNWVRQESACYECHTSYTMFGPLTAKFKGLRHLYVYYVQGGEGAPKLYDKYDARQCLRCHGPSRRYLKMRKHTRDENLLKDLVEGKRSCIESDCHSLVHLKETGAANDKG
ncbi:MAG: NapC/NirT family cytochrome c [Nitrospinae bacterium]|nr:NapC/NirT family cytochrome c [Nitrospinota bacterium]